MIYSFVITILLLFSPQSDIPQTAKAHCQRGFLFIEEFNYTHAIEEFDKALELDKNCKEAYLGKGIAYYRSGDYNRREIYPEELIKKAIKIDKNYFVAKIHLAWCYYYKDQRDGAAEYMSELLKNENPAPELYFEAAKFYDFIDNYYYKNYKSKTFHLLKTAYKTGCSIPDCLYMLGWKYFIQDSTNQALQFYNKGLEIVKEESNYKPLLDLAVIYYNLGEIEKSNEYFVKAVKIMPEDIRVCFKELTEDYENNLFRKVKAALSIKFFSDYFGNITDEGKSFLEDNFITYEKHPAYELAFMCLLTDNETESYKRQKTVPEKLKFRKNYFITRDLTPFDKTENIKEEFEKRFNYVFEAFKARTQEGFDDRGKIYLKYGEPDVRHQVSDIEIDPTPELNLNKQENKIKISSKTRQRINIEEMIENTKFSHDFKGLNAATESWSYVSLDIYLSFDFLALDGANYKQIPDLSVAISRRGTGVLNERIWIKRLYSYYEKHLHLGGIYPAIYQNIWKILNQVGSPGWTIFADLAEIDFKRYDTQKSIPTFFPTVNNEKYLNFNFRTADFKHGRKGSRNELYYGLNLKRLKFKKAGDEYNSSIKLSYKLLDENLKEVKTDSIFFTLSSQTEDAKGIAFNQLNYVTEPGEYTLILQMRNPEGNRLGILTEKINIDDYSTKKLNLSGIQFSFDIKGAGRKNRFIKNGLDIKPFPFYEVSSAKPIYLYYEIYNLQKNSAGKTNYEIEYDIQITEYKKSFLEKALKLGDDKKESISMSGKESGNQSNIFKYTSVDLSSLKPGKYNLKVSIKDLKTGENVKKTISFLLTK